MDPGKISVLIVDDSATARLALRRALASEASLEIVAELGDAKAALAFLAGRRVDLIVMDVFLGRADGIELTRQIMRRHPTPILIVTGADATDAGLVFRAVEAGALELVAKPPGPGAPDHARACRRLARRVKSLAGVPVVTHTRPERATRPPRAWPSRARALSPGLVVVGASTGGPPVVQTVLRALPRPFPLPIVIVQHVAEGFDRSMVSWLSQSTEHRVEVCDAAQLPEPGRVLVAPAGRHLRLVAGGRAVPFDGPERDYQRPSVDVVFESAAAVFGAAVVGVLLTGMGRDGVAGLAALRRVEALTIAQSPETCAVSGMATIAVERGLADHTLDPVEIAALLSELVTPRVTPARVTPEENRHA